ncbi:MAG: response regulator [Thalassobaculaceae bacterium]|nr:response regulator [bacterium]|tara:strand:+ start:990 stop:1361 length:372 start_codon:yes stop_codon:yes gene_type:complete
MSKLLYVEDNEDNIYMLSRRLKRNGFDLVIARDGEEGVEKAEKEVPDLILMDLSLPKLDGWGATKALKKNEKTQHIPIIALSAHAMQEHKESALQAGCNDYDTKPVDFARLLSKIEEQLAKVN